MAPIHSHRLEYSLPPPSSCEGEPVPDLTFDVAVLMLLLLVGFPKGDRTAVLAGCSMGDVLAVDDPERGWVADICGRWLRFIWWSGFGDGAIMNYRMFFLAEGCRFQGQSRCDTWVEREAPPQ